MKSLKPMIIFVQLLTYLSIYMNMSADASNNETLLELRQVTLPQAPKITSQPLKTLPVKTNTTRSMSEISQSQPYISFGFLIPGDPIIRSDQIHIKTTTPEGATLFVAQDSLLSSADKQSVIPNTSCDNGGCSSSLATVWKSPLTFGFGVRCENKESCLADFETEDTYRPLSTAAYPFLSIDTVGDSELLYKLNIAANQVPVPYTNSVTYILIPNL